MHLFKAFLHFYKDIYLIFNFPKKFTLSSGCNINGVYRLKELKLNNRRIKRYIAQKRGISTEKLLSTIKPNLKRKNNEVLTTKTNKTWQKHNKN